MLQHRFENQKYQLMVITSVIHSSDALLCSGAESEFGTHFSAVSDHYLFSLPSKRHAPTFFGAACACRVNGKISILGPMEFGGKMLDAKKERKRHYRAISFLPTFEVPAEVAVKRD